MNDRRRLATALLAIAIIADPAEIVAEAVREYVGDGDGADEEVLANYEQSLRAEGAAKALRDFADAMERDDWTHRDDWGVNCAYSFEVRARADALETKETP